jgi:hypothetical protein
MSDKEETPHEEEFDRIGEEEVSLSASPLGSSPQDFEVTDTLGVRKKLGFGMTLENAKQLSPNTLQVYNGQLRLLQSDASIQGKLTLYSGTLIPGTHPSLSVDPKTRQNQLQLQGALRVSDTLQIDQQVGIGISPSNTTRLLIKVPDTQMSLQTWQNSNGGSVAIVDAGGKVGIGTVTPTARLSVQGLFTNKVGLVQLKAHTSIVSSGDGTSFDTLNDNDLVYFPGLLAAQKIKTFTITKNSDGTLSLNPKLDLSADQTIDMYTDETLFQVANGNQQARLTVNSSGNVIITGALTVLGTVNLPQLRIGKDQVSFTADAIGGLTSASPLDGAKLNAGSVTAAKVTLKASDVGALAATASSTLAANNTLTIATGATLKVQGTLDATGATVTGLTAASLHAVATNTNSTITAGNTLTIAGTLNVTGQVQGINIQGLSTSGGTVSNTTSFPPVAIFRNFGSGSALACVVATEKDFASGSGNSELMQAAVSGISRQTNVYGVYASARDKTAALYVDGFGQSSGGFDPGHIVDRFVNASGQTVQMGDVVKLKGTSIVRFRGVDKKIPVAEVTLADQDHDTMVIGIVDRQASFDPEAPSLNMDQHDPPSVANGEEFYVVALGAYAHCKVDATEEAIEVGDLLTTSSNPGCARKAKDTKVGHIIGKALEPFREGVGHIAVFVNIQ